MRKYSDIAAGKVGKVVLGFGLIAAAVSPLAGALLGGWSTGAAVLSSWGLGAAAPLAAAGAFGGMLLGVAAMPFVAIGSVAAAGLVALTTKAIGSSVEWMFGNKATPATPAVDIQRQVMIDPAGSRLNKLKLGASFDAALLRKAAKENKIAPVLKMQHRPAFA